MASVFKSFIASSVMTLLCFSLCFYPFALAQDSGTATFNTPPYVPSKCYGYEDRGVMIAAASEGIFKNGEAFVVMITDLCPPDSCRGTIDLSQEAFASIADPNSGVINISYQQ
ncbi:EG45-like domain containing protein isoform X2 [Populus alba x Populus x berolinensis]|nr:EG45-like domain containing protein isoform X2 [Populus alba x Populus x berolinensis]